MSRLPHGLKLAYLYDEVEAFHVVHEVFGAGRYDALVGETIIDVGAYIGLSSLKFAINGFRRVVAIEPAPLNFRLLNLNLKLNKDKVQSDVTPLNAAAWDVDDKVVFMRAEPTYAQCYIIGDKHESSYRPINKFFSANTITLDSLTRRLHLKRVDAIKIDVEGSELPVLYGASATLDQCHNLAVEYHSERNRRELNRMLRERGFKIFAPKVKFSYKWVKSFLCSNLRTIIKNPAHLSSINRSISGMVSQSTGILIAIKHK